MRLLTFAALLFALMGSLIAAPVKKDILVGAFSTPKQAQFRNMKLEAYLGHDPVVNDLMKQKRFYFDVKYGNGMYRSVLTHFVSDQESQTVLQSVKRIFPDAYMLPTAQSGIPPINKPVSTTKRTVKKAEPKPAPAPKPVPAVTRKTAPAPSPKPKAVHTEPVAVAAAAAPVDDDIVVIDETQEDETPEPEAEAVKSIVAPVADEPVAETVTPEAPAQESDTPWLLYGIVLAVVVLALLFFLARRKKPQTRVLKTPEMINLEAEPQTAEPEVQTPVSEEAPVSTEPEPMVEAQPEPTVENAPEPVAEETIAVSPEPEPAPPAASPRKKRELPKALGEITKERLAEFAGNRVLVAEDNLINQKVITKLLEGSGIELTMANNGQEAIDMLTADPTYAMVLMDAHMPVKDGFEATREIRRNILFEPIVVVALSGDVSSDDIRKMREAGMEEQLAKPLKIDELYKVLYQYLDIKGEQKEEAEQEAHQHHASDQPLNSDEGLEICGDDMVMYIEILDEFVAEYGSADALVHAYLKANDEGKLVALMLDIKGVAANIGADPLSEAAEILREAVLINQIEAYEKLTEEFGDILHKTLTAIEHFKSTHLQ